MSGDYKEQGECQEGPEVSGKYMGKIRTGRTEEVSVQKINAKIGLKNGPPWAEIFEGGKSGCSLVWPAMLKNGFANFSAHGGPFLKPIFALKPWDRDGHFEYNKR